MRKGLTEKEIKLVEILDKGGIWGVSRLSSDLEMTPPAVRRLVRKLRMKFLDGNKDVPRYVYTAKQGYSFEESASTLSYESDMRIRLGLGTLWNGRHVFKRFKKLSGKEFKGLMIEYKPKAEEVQKVIG